MSITILLLMAPVVAVQEPEPAPALEMLATWEEQCALLAERLPELLVDVSERTTGGVDAEDAAERRAYFLELTSEKHPDRVLPEEYVTGMFQPAEAEHVVRFRYRMERENGDVRELSLDADGTYRAHSDWIAESRAMVRFGPHPDGGLYASVWPIKDDQHFGHLPIVPSEFAPGEIGDSIRWILRDPQGTLVHDDADRLEVRWEWRPGGRANPVETRMPPGFDVLGRDVTIVLRRIAATAWSSPAYMAELSYHDLRGRPLRHTRAIIEAPDAGAMRYVKEGLTYPVGSGGAPDVRRSSIRGVDGGVLPLDQLDALVPDLVGVPVQDWRDEELGGVEYTFTGKLPTLAELRPAAPAVDEF